MTAKPVIYATPPHSRYDDGYGHQDAYAAAMTVWAYRHGAHIIAVDAGALVIGSSLPEGPDLHTIGQIAVRLADQAEHEDEDGYDTDTDAYSPVSDHPLLEYQPLHVVETVRAMWRSIQRVVEALAVGTETLIHDDIVALLDPVILAFQGGNSVLSLFSGSETDPS